MLDLDLLVNYEKSINSITTLKNKIKSNKLASKVLGKDFSGTQTKISVVGNVLTYLNHLKNIKMDDKNVLFILNNPGKIELIKKMKNSLINF